MHPFSAVAVRLLSLVGSAFAAGLSVAASPDFKKDVEPLLIHYCYDCHGDGSSEGDFELDKLAGDQKAVEHWRSVWNNVRSSIMPPSDEEQPTPAEVETITRWISSAVFKVDPANPDPGRVTIRRLNRREYHNTVKDLLGVDYSTTENFPPDDTGYGFDTIGDVLTISPLHMEKYLAAAEDIARRAVPSGGARIPIQRVSHKHFARQDDPNYKKGMNWLSFQWPTTYKRNQRIDHKGRYKISLEFAIDGSPEATANTGDIILKIGDREISRQNYGWDNREKIVFQAEVDLEEGNHDVYFLTEQTNPAEEGEGWIFARGDHVQFEGPMDGSVLEYPPEFRRIFPTGAPQATVESRRKYARDVLQKIGGRAFRRPLDPETLERLMALYRVGAEGEEQTFEDGVRLALTGILTSPRFLLRAETQPQPDDPTKVVDLDDFALASRLSYFLWSSLPDQRLHDLAASGKLRDNLTAEIDRMLLDERSWRFTHGFVGQWLSAVDVTSISIDAPRALGVKSVGDAEKQFSQRLRGAMLGETLSFVRHLTLNDRPIGELLTADYSFINEELAKWYGVDGVKGSDFRLVHLPPEVKRGGILTHGSFHVVTSNPTRTSPVKRGLFILDNILGTPAPPPPEDIPTLEEAFEAHRAEKPTMRELMAIHAEKKLCASCHSRMDPLGLALESYDGTGRYRETSRSGKPIDTRGKLITGESFANVQELQKVLATDRRVDLLRCVTERMMTYALGRGMEYYDSTEIDRIVAELMAEEGGGGMGSLVHKVVWSRSFLQRRGDGDRLSE